MRFTEPQLEVVRFDAVDVITTSYVHHHTAIINGVEYSFSNTEGSVNVVCPTDGLTYGTDYICVSGYNA